MKYLRILDFGVSGGDASMGEGGSTIDSIRVALPFVGTDVDESGLLCISGNGVADINSSLEIEYIGFSDEPTDSFD